MLLPLEQGRGRIPARRCGHQMRGPLAQTELPLLREQGTSLAAVEKEGVCSDLLVTTTISSSKNVCIYYSML